jgi:drug/metabolite transporter (DMT)-like permease
MAQTRRRRKHRGTQSGSIDRRGRRARPRSRQEARARAKQRVGTKRDHPPTWSSAVTRGLLGAGVFAVLLVALFGRPLGEAAGLSALMLLIYIPMGHFFDRFFYSRRQAAARRERERRASGE